LRVLFSNIRCFGLTIIQENWAKLKKNTLYNVFIKSVKWTLQDFSTGLTNVYVSINGKMYLVCSEIIAVLKEYINAMLYNLKHKEQYKNHDGDMEIE
jgi:hypothetical protein